MKYVGGLILALLATTLYGQCRNGVCNQFVRQNVVKQRVVEFDADYYYGTHGYYSMTNNIVNNKLNELEKDNIRLRAEVDVLWKLLQNRPANPHPPVEPDPTPDKPIEPDTPDAEPTELDGIVYNIFEKNCARCHNSQQETRMKLIDTNAGVLFNRPLNDRVEIFDRTFQVGLSERGKKGMPPGKTLSDKDVEALRLWMIQEAERLQK